MKITKTITVDMDVWQEAQNHTDNLSGYINECLKGLNSRRSNEALTKEQLQIEIDTNRQIIRDASIKESLALQALKDFEATKLSKIKESLENERFKRWKCPVCKHLNFMEELRCSGCNLPTRNESKTEIVTIEEAK